MKMKIKAEKNKQTNITEDLLLLAFVFIGLGFGVAYTQIAAGLLIGFGVGMIFREMLRPKESRPYTLKMSLSVAAYILILIAVYFIVLGVALIENYVFFYPYNTSYLLVIIGIILIILYGVERREKK
ncbi:MAG: hypothetical protein ACP5RI_00450 [Candidatus Micrarchaeia archaeon]